MPTPPAEKPRLTREERSARRAARREQQRTSNLLRAAQMHAARLAETGLPLPQHALPAVNVGCSGWFYWHWRGGFYPPELPTSGWFPRYAEHFRTVELNAPFYGWPTLAAVRGWVRQAAGREFVYTIKVSELITHVRRFEGTKTLVRDFGYIADLLGDRMGCFLFQLPPSFHFTTARLRRLLSQLEPHRRNVLESATPAGGMKRMKKSIAPSRDRHDLLLLQRSASAGGTRLHRTRDLPPFPRPQRVVSARLHRRRAPHLGRPRSRR